MLVSLMGSSILSEGCQHLDSQDGALQCYYDPLNRLPVSRLLLPLSGLERSDCVHWPLADISKSKMTWKGRRREALRLNYGSTFVAVKGLNPCSARAAH